MRKSLSDCTIDCSSRFLFRNLDTLSEQQANRVTDIMSKYEQIEITSNGSIDSIGLSSTTDSAGLNIAFGSEWPSPSAVSWGAPLRSDFECDGFNSGYTVSSAMACEVELEICKYLHSS